MSIAYVVLKLEREGQSDPPPVLSFSKKPSLGRVKRKSLLMERHSAIFRNLAPGATLKTTFFVGIIVVNFAAVNIL